MADGPDIPDRIQSELNIKAKLTGRAGVKKALGDIGGDAADLGLILASAGQSRETRELEKQLNYRLRVKQLMDEGFSRTEAMGHADKEVFAASDTEDANRDQFLRQRNQQIDILQAEGRGDKRGAQGLRDGMRFDELLQENLAGGIGAEQAARLAKDQAYAEIGSEEQGKGFGIKSDQFQRLGLGGFATGSDPAMRVRERQLAVLEKMEAHMAAIQEDNTMGGPL